MWKLIYFTKFGVFFERLGLIWFGFEVSAGTAMRGVFHTVSL